MAAAQGAALRILAVNGKKELHETVWNPPTASSDARFDPRFRKVGTWNPANGPLHSLAASTVQDPPPAGTARVVLDSLPVLRQTAGAAPDPRVTRLQQLPQPGRPGRHRHHRLRPARRDRRLRRPTADAVRRLQKAKSLPETGILDAGTWRAFVTFLLSAQPPSP